MKISTLLVPLLASLLRPETGDACGAGVPSGAGDAPGAGAAFRTGDTSEADAAYRTGDASGAGGTSGVADRHTPPRRRGGSSVTRRAARARLADLGFPLPPPLS